MMSTERKRLIAAVVLALLFVVWFAYLSAHWGVGETIEFILSVGAGVLLIGGGFLLVHTLINWLVAPKDEGQA